MKDLLKLFLIFLKLGITNFGGGYALLPILEEELAVKRTYATKEELQDYFAVGQCTPGVISVNVSTFIGFKLHGFIGAIVTTLGFIIPSIVVICLIAALLQNFMDYKYVKHAFNGVNIAVALLIFKTVIKMLKKNIVDTFTVIMYITVLLLAIFSVIPTFLSVIICGALGILINIKKSTKRYIQ